MLPVVGGRRELYLAAPQPTHVDRGVSLDGTQEGGRVSLLHTHYSRRHREVW